MPLTLRMPTSAMPSNASHSVRATYQYKSHIELPNGPLRKETKKALATFSVGS